jgi:murein DD-endopeptidase MepM/ murein hydrolase activator NlpD
MALLIVSAGHLTNSRPRTVRAKPLLLAAGSTALALMAACALLGYQFARSSMPTASTSATDMDRPEYRVLVGRIGTLAGQLAQLQTEAAALAQRLGAAPVAAALAVERDPSAAGGPLVPVGGIDRLEADAARLERALGLLATAAVERELDSMAFPNRMPVAGQRVPISSSYGTRHDPFTGRLARHSGLDIPAAHGVPILASGGGRVVFAGRKGAYGQTVVIDHGDGLASLYGHASRILVRVGDIVLPQQKIALVGSTGRSTGPHLHFEVIRHGVRVEPRQYLKHVLEPRVQVAAQ